MITTRTQIVNQSHQQKLLTNQLLESESEMRQRLNVMVLHQLLEEVMMREDKVVSLEEMEVCLRSVYQSIS